MADAAVKLKEPVATEPEMIPILLRTFIGGSKAPSDIYVQIADDHYVKVFRKDDPMDQRRLANYKGREISTVYMTPEDFRCYNETCMRMIDFISEKDIRRKSQYLPVINRMMEAVMLEISRNDLDEKVYEKSTRIVREMTEIVAAEANLEVLLFSISEMSEDFIKHSACVAMVATMIAHKVGWKSERVLRFVGMAGLFHDIGFKELPEGLADKRRVDMTREEIKLYETHPERSAQILQSVNSIPTEVIAAVRDHHEERYGSGFPRGLRGEQIYPLSQVIHVADTFSELILKTKNNPHPHSPKRALLYLSTNHRANQYLDALYEILMVRQGGR